MTETAPVIEAQPNAVWSDGFWQRNGRRVAGLALVGVTAAPILACSPGSPASSAGSQSAEASKGGDASPTTTPARLGTVHSWVGQAVLLPGERAHTVVRWISEPGQNDSFKDFAPAPTEPGPKIPVGTKVDVDCYMFDATQWDNPATKSMRGVYYHIISPEALKGLFTVTNTFENDSDGALDNRRDPAIPQCPQSPTKIPAPIQGTTLPPR